MRAEKENAEVAGETPAQKVVGDVWDKVTQRGDEFRTGCFLTVLVIALLGVGAVAFFNSQLSPPKTDDGSSPHEDAGAFVLEDGDAPSSLASFVDPENPRSLIPTAGEYTVVNGRFVPNCGPDDPELQMQFDSGTIDVWSAGALLHLEGTNSGVIPFERTSVSQDQATYAGELGFVRMELVFDSSTAFAATVSYTDEGQCVQRTADGTLVEPDPARQHGAEDPPSTGGTVDSLQKAGDETLAVVTIDGESYEFHPEGPAGTCDPDFFGAFHAVLYSEGYADSFNVELWPDGSRTSSGSVTVNELGYDLVADEDGEWAAVEPGTSYVADFEINGNTATGTLSTINEDRAYSGANYPLEPMKATFTVTCVS